MNKLKMVNWITCTVIKRYFHNYHCLLQGAPKVLIYLGTRVGFSICIINIIYYDEKLISIDCEQLEVNIISKEHGHYPKTLKVNSKVVKVAALQGMALIRAGPIPLQNPLNP